MDGIIGVDAVTGLARATVALVESGGVLAAGLAFAAALTVAFCLGRLVERAVAQLRNTARMPPGE
jgi:hypothetical protein